MTTREPPLLLVDVDGVLNIHPSVPSAGRWLQVTVHGFKILANRDVLDFLCRAHADRMAEVRWLTTWETGDYYVQLAERLCLPAGMPVHGRKIDHPAGDYRWWKYAAVLAADDGRRRTVWVDDDLKHDREAMSWVWGQAPRVRAFSPEPERGITPRMLREMEGFLLGGDETWGT